MALVERTSARVYDPVLRLLHWVNAFLIALLLVSGLVAFFSEPGETSAWLHEWHGLLGAALLTSLLGRVAWGLYGPAHALFTEMWQPGAWRKAFASRSLFEAPASFGHHPVASLAYLVAYVLLAGLSLSGLMLLAVKQGLGPFSQWLAWDAAWLDALEPLHEVSAWCVLGFVGLHLAALVLHPLLHRVPVAQAMFTGIQYLPRKNS